MRNGRCRSFSARKVIFARPTSRRATARSFRQACLRSFLRINRSCNAGPRDRCYFCRKRSGAERARSRVTIITFRFDATCGIPDRRERSRRDDCSSIVSFMRIQSATCGKPQDATSDNLFFFFLFFLFFFSFQGISGKASSPARLSSRLPHDA